jgi:hypothetical protein
MTTPPATNWRTQDTPATRSAFYAAQTRLDNAELTDDGRCITVGVDNYTREMQAADQATADRYDQLVLQPAHAEFERKCDEAEFAAQFPEPPDGARIEFGADSGFVVGAFREDDPDQPSDAHWYVYGSVDAYTWRDLVFRYEINMNDMVLFVPAQEDVPDPAPAPAALIAVEMNAAGYPTTGSPVDDVRLLLNELDAARSNRLQDRRALAEKIAADIRAELVCACIEMEPTEDLWHSSCRPAELAARIAEQHREVSPR